MTPSSASEPAWKSTFSGAIKNIFNDSDHPMQIALRTHALCLSLTLGPNLLPVFFSLAVRPETFRTRARVFLRVVSKELRITGFASAMSIAVGGGVALQRFWDSLGRRCRTGVHHTNPRVPPFYRAFLANVLTSTIAVILLRWRRSRRPGTSSPTLDLGLFFLVRALDASVQASIIKKSRETAVRHLKAVSRHSEALDARTLDIPSEELAKEWRTKAVTRLDALVFWACSARVTWCFFYQPQRLPPSYVKWIKSLAHVDGGLLEVLRALRKGRWSYIHGSSAERSILVPLAEKLGYPLSWVDPVALPAYGGSLGNDAWKQLQVIGRDGIGGLPCELVHGRIGARFGLGKSCAANAAIRAMYAFAESLVLYLPVHFLPVLLTRPKSTHRCIAALLSAARSAVFLSTFVSSYWFAVCFARTLVLARFFPIISHDMWDGPCGGTLLGSLVCGASIWIENAKRRGELALYVIPRALGSLVSEEWLRSRHSAVQFAECLTFVLSLASLLTFSVHQPESMRGLSRWVSTFIMRGPNVGFWIKRKTEGPIYPPAPVNHSVPGNQED